MSATGVQYSYLGSLLTGNLPNAPVLINLCITVMQDFQVLGALSVGWKVPVQVLYRNDVRLGHT